MPLDVHPQLLRALQAVVETGSLTAASERLGFTQSALSKQIAALETSAGVPLLLRRPRGMEPTPAGRRLAQRAERVLAQLDAAARELSSAAHGPIAGEVRLGGFPAAAASLVPGVISLLRVHHPDVGVEFTEAATPVQLRRLRSDRLDIAIVAAGPDLPPWNQAGLVLRTLPVGHLKVAVATTHPMADRARVDVTELADEHWIAGRGSRGHPQFGAWPTVADPHVAASLTEWTARLGFVAAGIGVTTVPSLLATALPPGVVALEVEDPDLAPRSLVMATKEADLRPAAATVAEAVVAVAHRIARTGL